MEELDSPRPPAEPSEQELRAMIEDRERVQAASWGRMKTLSTRLLLTAIAAATIGFLGSGSNRDWLVSLVREAPAEAPVAKAADPLESEAEALKRAAKITTATPGDGKIIDQGDIRFAMELMEFMQGSAPAPKPAAEAPVEKDTEDDE